MFGRNEKAASRAERQRPQHWAEGAETWAAELKRPYVAAGLDVVAAAKKIDEFESKASGSLGHPWPDEVKVDMLKRVNGASTLPEFRQRLEQIQLAWEKTVAGEGQDDV